AHLGRQTQGKTLAFGKIDRGNLLAVVPVEPVPDRSVQAGYVLAVNGQWMKVIAALESRPQVLRQVGHVRKTGGAPLEKPVVNLPDVESGNPALLDKRGDVIGRNVQKGFRVFH